jgi:HTH-type transcriptional regulator/antitoxin HipB
MPWGSVELEAEVAQLNGRFRQRNGVSRRSMSQKKTVTKRHSWARLKRAKADREGRRRGYRQAKEAFELAERVRQARTRLGITQAELAARIGSTQPAMARLEAGGSTPSFDTLRRIAAALGLELVVELRARRVAA